MGRHVRCRPCRACSRPAHCGPSACLALSPLAPHLSHAAIVTFFTQRMRSDRSNGATGRLAPCASVVLPFARAMDGRSPITGSQTPNNPRVRTVGFSLSGGAGDQDEDPDVFQLDSGSSPSAPLPVIIPPAFQVSVRGASGPAYGAVDAGVHADNNGGSQRLLNSLTARLALSLPGSACFRNHARCRLLVSCACAGRGAASLLSPCRLSRPACASFAAVCTPGPQDCAYVRWAARAGDHLPVGHPAAAVAGQPPAGPCFQHSHGHGTSAAARGRRRPRPWGRASRGGRRQAQERAAGGAEAEVESGRAARDPGGAACGQG